MGEQTILFPNKERRIVHVFYSESLDAQVQPTSVDRYYRNAKGEWKKATGIYSCVTKGKEEYICRYDDWQYFGPAYADTLHEVPRGVVFPAPEHKEPIGPPLPKPIQEAPKLPQTLPVIKKKIPVLTLEPSNMWYTNVLRNYQDYNDTD